MKNQQKIGVVLASLVTILYTDLNVFLGANNLSFLAKCLIVGITGIGELIALLAIIYSKPRLKSEEKAVKTPFDLTVKLYSMLVFAATSIYTIGIWILTPFVVGKDWFLGIGLAIQILLFLYFSLRKTKEAPDERFYANLTKSASVMFAICLLVFLILASLTAYFGTLELSAGMLFIATGIFIFLYSIVYFFFERRG